MSPAVQMKIQGVHASPVDLNAGRGAEIQTN